MNYNAGAGLFQGVRTGLDLIRFRDNRARQAKQDLYAEEDRALRLEDRQLRLKDRDRNIERQDAQDERATELHGARMQNQALQSRISTFNFTDAVDKKNREQLSNALNFSEAFYDAMDGNDDIDQQAFLKSLNGLFDEEVGQGKQITGIYPHEDKGVLLELGVDDGKGGSRKAPMTQNRSDAPDDPVMVVPWEMMFNYASQIDTKLKEAGYDMSSPESRQKAFDAFHALTGNNRSQKRKAAAEKSRKPSEVMEILHNYRKPDGSQLTYAEAFQMSKQGSTPQTNNREELRHWTKMHQEAFQNMKSPERKEIREAWKEVNPGKRFSPTKWAREQAEESMVLESEGSVDMSSFPNPAKFEGRTIRHKSSGKFYQSVGGQWVEAPGGGVQ